MNKTELKLRRELWWIYANILYNYGKFDKELTEKRMKEIRFVLEVKGE